jgi:hypothetical protein
MEVADAGERETVVHYMRMAADLPEAVFYEGRAEMSGLLQGCYDSGD